jgi:hypothetical protein
MLAIALVSTLTTFKVLHLIKEVRILVTVSLLHNHIHILNALGSRRIMIMIKKGSDSLIIGPNVAARSHISMPGNSAKKKRLLSSFVQFSAVAVPSPRAFNDIYV